MRRKSGAILAHVGERHRRAALMLGHNVPVPCIPRAAGTAELPRRASAPPKRRLRRRARRGAHLSASGRVVVSYGYATSLDEARAAFRAEYAGLCHRAYHPRDTGSVCRHGLGRSGRAERDCQSDRAVQRAGKPARPADRSAAGLSNPAGLAPNSSLGSPERRFNGAGRQAA
jgi:hypothetical protein